MARKSSLAASTVLYVGQLPYDWDEQTIKSVVCGSGKIVDVRLGFDYAGKNKGFCFIEYQNSEEAQKALRLLDQVKLLNPNANGQFKKLRIELSKEGLRSNAPSENKPVLMLDRNSLPNYVQLPQEMIYNGPPIPPSTFNQSPSASPFQTVPIQPQIPMSYGQTGATGPQMGTKLTTATKILPQPPTLPFAVPDKINETLSQIPPAQLVELIANLKNILNGPNSSRAVDVFQLSPHLATAAAQALLLMGFIDGDVINESMKSASSTPVPQAQPPAANHYGQPLQQQHQPPTKWPHLPPATQAKLAVMASEQADLVAQVLSLPADQISSLPPDKQSMVINLRAQYL